MHLNADDPELSEVFPHDDDIAEPVKQSNITHLKGKPAESEESQAFPFSREKQIEWQEKHRAEAEESLADLLTAILNRLDILESHFTPAGLDILSETLERRLVTRLRRQGSVNFPAIK